MLDAVKIASRQKVTAEDFNNLGLYPRASFDALTEHAIGAAAKYSGGGVSILSTTKVLVDTPVFLIRDGRWYVNRTDDGVEMDLLGSLPASGFKRVVALSLTGSEVSDQVAERDFLTNPVTRATEAQPTATRSNRYAQVNAIAGAAAVDPAPPAVPAEHTVIAHVLLTPTGIESVSQVLANRLPQLIEVNGRLVLLEEWQARTAPVIDGLKSDVAKLMAEGRGKADRGVISYLLEQTARLNEAEGIAPDAAFSVTDFFLTEDDSDTAHLAYQAKVEEGLRFSDENAATFSPVLANPADTRLVIHPGGLLLPAYAEVPVISNLGKDSEVALSNAGSQTTDYTQRTVARTRIRWGQSFLVSINSIWWRTGRYDPATHIFRRGGETWEVSAPDAFMLRLGFVRAERFWKDDYEEVYWDAVTTDASYVGTVNAQTFLAPRAGWMTKVRLGFSRLDSAGDVRIILSRCTANAAPDPKNTLATVLVPRASLKLYPEITDIALPPTYVEAGERVAVHLVTGGNHWLAMTEGNKYGQGSFFASTDGAWFQGDITRDACMQVLMASFTAPRLEIALDPWNLSGGIEAVDMNLDMVARDPAGIIFEVRHSGTWYQIGEVGAGNHPLYGLPAQVQARMVLVGTTDVMPGIWLGPSKVTLTRPRTTGTHISKARATPVDVNEVHVVALLEHFDDVVHDCGAQLLTGAGYATPVSPTATVDKVLPGGTTRRTFTFSGLTPDDTYKRKITLSTASALSVFHVAEATDIAFPS
jgi:hypothetical protein